MSEQAKLLIVDDELSVRDSLGKWFREEGYVIGAAENGSQALSLMAENSWDAALVDIKMRGIDGIELQRRMHEIDPNLMVILMTGYASVDTAVQALKNGAYDYVSKPLDPDEIAHLVKKAIAHRRTEQENVRLRETVAEVARPEEMVGQSAAMQKVFDAIETVGPTDATVLVTGESGTGKELVARAIHHVSPRRFHPLVVIHCGALTETLLESELFGHEKGAFTGAQYRKKGKFEVADGGTVFLDEISDISLKTQTDLLRVLQEKEIVRVGGNQQIKVDFRCIAATNKNLETLVKAGSFRPDLYYRLHVFCIDLPPLRERRDDIPLLVNHFLNKFCLATSRPMPVLSPEALDVLMRHDWPGNV
ncbi:MAG TPA: sigma-54 dependent transcriptional regulator, partial [Terriglobales bacterium]|nr:sigma-54 dependent transcriptional regulator [Terriglobales bacterium]